MSSKHYEKYIPDTNENDILGNVSCSGNMMLEPRLQEYIKKRQYCRDNDIEPTVPLEKEFSITNTDKKLLRTFLSGNTNVYKQAQYEKLISEKPKQKSFPSTYFKEDPRVLKINKSENKTPLNRGMFVPDKKDRYYEDPVVKQDDKIFDSRDFSERAFKGFDAVNSKFNPRIDPKINPGFEPHDKCDSQYRVSDGSVYDSCAPQNKRKYNRDDKNSYNDYNNDPHQTYLNYDLMDDYSNNMNRVKKSQQVQSHQNRPRQNQSQLKKSHPDAKMLNQTKRNTELESELIRGMPTMRPHNRSYGYRDTFENNFDYIEDDFQNPDNTDIWVRGGEPTRADNKMATKNKTYVREVM